MSKRMLPTLAALMFSYVSSAGCTLVVKSRLDAAALPCSAENLEMESHDWTHGTCTVVPGDRLRLSMLEAPSGGKVYVVPKIGGHWLTDDVGSLSVLTFDGSGEIAVSVPYLDVAPGESVEFMVFDSLPSGPSEATRMKPVAKITFSYSHVAALLSSDGRTVTVAEITDGAVGWHTDVTLPVSIQHPEMIRDPSGRYLIVSQRVSTPGNAVPMVIIDLLNPDDISVFRSTAGLASVSFPALVGHGSAFGAAQFSSKYLLMTMDGEGSALMAWSPDGTAVISFDNQMNSIVQVHEISPEISQTDDLYAMVWSSGTTLTLGTDSEGTLGTVQASLWGALDDVRGTCAIEVGTKDGTVSEPEVFGAPFVLPMDGYLVFLSSMPSSGALAAGIVSDSKLFSRMQEILATKEKGRKDKWCFYGGAPGGMGIGDWHHMSLEWATSGGAPFAVSSLVPSNGGLSGSIVVFDDHLEPSLAYIITNAVSQEGARPVFMGCHARSGRVCLPLFSYIIPGSTESNYIRVDVTESSGGEILFGDKHFSYRAAGPVTVPFESLSFLYESSEGHAVLLGVGSGGLYEVDSLLLNDGKPDNDTDRLLLEGEFSSVSCHP